MLQIVRNVVTKTWYIMRITFAAAFLRPNKFNIRELMIGFRWFSIVVAVNTLSFILLVIMLFNHDPKFIEITLILICCVIEMLGVIELPMFVIAWKKLPE